MISKRAARRLTAMGGVAALVLTLAPASSADHANPPGPVNAATTYGWGMPPWQDDFVGPRKKIWRVRAAGRGNVQTQHGMLTLNTGRFGNVSATLKGRGHEVGRWEIRLRSRQWENKHTRYQVRTELIPAGARKQHCGARNVALESYTHGRRIAHFYTRNLPDLNFTGFKGLNLGNERWHTFAVEITHKRISWFVDAHVIVTERRDAALSGVPLTVRFTMVGEPGQRMNESRMQMDWVRYWTLRKPNKRSIAAPPATLKTYADAC